MSEHRPRLVRSIPRLDARVRAPSSKSLTIRAMAAAALAPGRSRILRPLRADDTRLMADALAAIGIGTTWDPGGDVVVDGAGGKIPARGAAIALGNAGTPLRLLTAVCTLGAGRFLIDGDSRMRQRPSRHLIDALGSLGIAIRSVPGTGCPPIEILAGGFPGGRVTLPGDASSQYLTALLMTAPCGASPLEVEVTGPLVSRPYVDLTVHLLGESGVKVARDGWSRFRVTPTPYIPRDITIEGDASSASYFFAAAAVTGGRVEVTGIPTGSLQGDLRFLDLIAGMGCRVVRDGVGIIVEGTDSLRGIDADLSDTPDLVPTCAATALFARGATHLANIPHLRIKESDRIASVAACARAFGARAEDTRDSLTIIPPPGGRGDLLRGAVIDPAGDHRLAMAFAVAGLAIEGTRIADPGCVAKSYPGFFEDLDSLTSAR